MGEYMPPMPSLCWRTCSAVSRGFSFQELAELLGLIIRSVADAYLTCTHPLLLTSLRPLTLILHQPLYMRDLYNHSSQSLITPTPWPSISTQESDFLYLHSTSWPHILIIIQASVFEINDKDFEIRTNFFKHTARSLAAAKLVWASTHQTLWESCSEQLQNKRVSIAYLSRFNLV